MIRFRFTTPNGFNGWHGIEVLEATRAHCVLEHRIEMRVEGLARLTWPLMIRHLHDALIEDALAQAQAALGNPPVVRPWSIWVRLLRRLLDSRHGPGLETGRARTQGR